MKNSLVACLMLCFSISFAQLSVQNDAYVFVNDQVLFVTDDVNIDDANSKIYLRNEAQLLQGSGTTGNSGVGELSVYQNGTVNQWAYNYWCSPVGGILTNAFGNNDFRIDQLDDPLLSTLSTTDSNNSLFTTAYEGTADPLLISSRWLWMFVSSDEYSEWIPAAIGGNANVDINPGLGFTMKGTGTATTGNTDYDFRGKPNNGTITNPVANTQFTLVGNPYPSALDARDFIHDPSNVNEIDGTLFYWEQSGTVESHVLQDYIGGYATYTIDNSGTLETFNFALFFTYDEQDNSTPVFTPPPTPVQAEGIKVAGRYIPIGQGFMVEGINGPNGEVTHNNTMREFVKEDGTTSIFFRTTNNYDENESASANEEIQYQANGLSIVPGDYKRFRINADFSVNESQYTRQLVLNFHNSATMGYDRGLELKLAQEYNSDAYFELDNKSYSGQAYAFEETLIIPMTVDIEEQQPLRFRIFDIQNFEESQSIYIHDKENDVYVNLRDQDYELNIEPGNYTNRFEIVFTPQDALNIKEFDTNSLVINQNNGIHQLSVLNPKNIDITSIEVFDVAGKRLLNGNYDTVLNRYELSTVDLSDGVYIVNVKSNTNAIKSQKVIVKN